MKATAAAVLAFVLMFVFSHRPLVRGLGRTQMWVLLLIDLIVAIAVFALVW